MDNNNPHGIFSQIPNRADVEADLTARVTAAQDEADEAQLRANIELTEDWNEAHEANRQTVMADRLLLKEALFAILYSDMTEVDQMKALMHLVGPRVDQESERSPEDAPDWVNHPPHYKQHPSGVECIEITRHMGFNLGNAVKYIWRAGSKGDVIQDLEKAAFYINDEIERLKKERDA